MFKVYLNITFKPSGVELPIYTQELPVKLITFWYRKLLPMTLDVNFIS